MCAYDVTTNSGKQVPEAFDADWQSATLQSKAVPGVFESLVLEPEAAGEDDESSVEGLDDFEDILVRSLTPTVQTWCLAQALMLNSASSYRHSHF